MYFVFRCGCWDFNHKPNIYRAIKQSSIFLIPKAEQQNRQTIRSSSVVLFKKPEKLDIGFIDQSVEIFSQISANNNAILWALIVGTPCIYNIVT